MTEQVLRPCPFCGDDAILEPDGRFQCINNDCVLYLQEFRDYERPSWNTRPIEDALQSRAERAEARVELMIKGITYGKYIKHGTPDATVSLMNWYQKLTALIAEWEERK